jgi:hypothetical protein
MGNTYLDAEHIERLKRDYIESTMSLVESFAQQIDRYAEDGDVQATLKALSNFDSFYRLAAEMVQRLQDRQNAAYFTARLRRICSGLQGSRCVA